MIVPLEDAAAGLPEAAQQRAPVVFKRPGQALRRSVDACAAAAVDLLGHAAPQLQVLVDHPVDQVMGDLVDPIRSVADHDALELLSE